MNARPTVVFETPFFQVEALSSPDMEGPPHYRLSGPDSAIMLVFNNRAEILVVRQFRPALGETTMEFPAGAIESGESPLAAAEREVLEETGYRSSLFQLGDYFHLMMNRTSIREYIFCGMVTAQPPRQSEPGIRGEWVARDLLREATFAGGYRQLAGLGIVHLASEALGLNVLTAPVGKVLQALRMNLSAPDGRSTNG
jgi:8-oxo-dGTP pyrophosphatase MutT (NUDIX family)